MIGKFTIDFKQYWPYHWCTL